jgi:uncharacterized protein YneF (UPF0154 family)
MSDLTAILDMIACFLFGMTAGMYLTRRMFDV